MPKTEANGTKVTLILYGNLSEHGHADLPKILETCHKHLATGVTPGNQSLGKHPLKYKTLRENAGNLSIQQL